MYGGNPKSIIRWWTTGCVDDVCHECWFSQARFVSTGRWQANLAQSFLSSPPSVRTLPLAKINNFTCFYNISFANCPTRPRARSVVLTTSAPVPAAPRKTNLVWLLQMAWNYRWQTISEEFDPGRLRGDRQALDRVTFPCDRGIFKFLLRGKREIARGIILDVWK